MIASYVLLVTDYLLRFTIAGCFLTSFYVLFTRNYLQFKIYKMYEKCMKAVNFRIYENVILKVSKKCLSHLLHCMCINVTKERSSTIAFKTLSQGFRSRRVNFYEKDFYITI